MDVTKHLELWHVPSDLSDGVPIQICLGSLVHHKGEKNVFVAMCINTSMLTFSLCDIDNDQIPQGVLLR